MTTANRFPALNGEPVTEAHARTCREQGHATHTVDGVDSGTCPRCGETTIPATPANVERLRVDSSQLRQGDVVLVSGMRVLLDREVRAHRHPSAPTDEGLVNYACRGLVTNLDEVSVVPVSWLRHGPDDDGPRWTIAGNNFAMWTIERSRPCGHIDSTLVETRGLGGFNPVEVYACDACGHRSEVRLNHEAEDSGFAPEGVGDEWTEEA